ncbi:hypothetical protein DL89DRAFT_88060 [Linderina pennispora]|uniref:Uncharacterized protein n=1 Tax=Linderina pennispora TaxID=61395 RepID=A0A1Y1WI05_9FUNG|nr:uncharacterized protein DL89DRAFT_88060 [Linderina pennispora]ORX73102.1 hypothetical protein DL89DRAFT_88060 [Linderina pennispora]
MRKHAHQTNGGLPEHRFVHFANIALQLTRRKPDIDWKLADQLLKTRKRRDLEERNGGEGSSGQGTSHLGSAVARLLGARLGSSGRARVRGMARLLLIEAVEIRGSVRPSVRRRVRPSRGGTGAGSRGGRGSRRLTTTNLGQQLGVLGRQRRNQRCGDAGGARQNRGNISRQLAVGQGVLDDVRGQVANDGQEVRGEVGDAAQTGGRRIGSVDSSDKGKDGGGGELHYDYKRKAGGKRLVATKRITQTW